MTEAHIGSVLPIKNRVLAADEHTTFLAHYDLNEHDVLRGVKAVDSSKVHTFTGSNYINLETPPHLQVIGDLTIEMWLKPANFSARRNPIAKAYGGEYTITQETSGVLNFYYGASGVNGGAYHGITSSAIIVGQWVHIAIVRDLVAKQLRWYINGKLDKLATISHTPQAGTEPVYIGRGYTNNYMGEISDVRIWAKAKTEENITDEMHQVKNESGLRARWLLEEGEGELINDSSPFHHDGVITGGSRWTQGKSIFTLHPEEGKFGGAIAVEEATTNVIPDALAWSGWNVSSYEDNTCDMEILNIDGIPTMHLYNVAQPTNSGYPRITGPAFSSSVTGSVSASFYAWSSGAGRLSMRMYEAGSTKHSMIPAVSKERKRYEDSHSSTFALDKAYIVPEQGHEYWIQMPQVEQVASSTSFINGSRSPGNLEYPLTLTQDFTVSFWMYHNWGTIEVPTGVHHILGEDNNSCAFMLRRWSDAPVRFYVYDGANTRSWADLWNIDETKNKWSHVAVTKSGKVYTIYKDGIPITTHTIAVELEKDRMMPQLGGNSPGNFRYDELRIDKVARTAEEIAAWYESNSPFWPRGIYRKSY